MNAAQINATFDLVDFVGKIVTLHKSSVWIGPCPMCGGRDRFNIKRFPNGDEWICRQCKGDKYHSTIDFLMEYWRVDFKEAVKRAGGEIGQPKKNETPRASQPPQAPPSQDWQAEAWRQVDEAHARLISSAGETGQEYLTARGISRGSIFMHLLGFAFVYNRPAIVMPYFDDNTITAIRYRFIDRLAQTDKDKRYGLMRGSKAYIFGLAHVIPSARNLLYVEGELNAISIIQQMPRGLSVVSGGSQTNAPALLGKLASRYDRVFIWMDDQARASQIAGHMGRGDATIIKSPDSQGRKWDANEMLQAGILPDFISRKFGAVCQAEG